MLSDPYFPVQLFNFCPACGQPLVAAKPGKSIHCRACDFLLYFNSSTAVAAIIVNTHNEVLFTMRRSDPAKGLLDLPGGFVDPGETAEEALVREIREELNLELSSFRFLKSFANTYYYHSVLYHTTDLVFVCQVIDFDPLQAGDDVSGFVFRNPRQILPSQIGLTSIKAALEYYLLLT